MNLNYYSQFKKENVFKMGAFNPGLKIKRN